MISSAEVLLKKLARAKEYKSDSSWLNEAHHEPTAVYREIERMMSQLEADPSSVGRGKPDTDPGTGPDPPPGAANRQRIASSRSSFFRHRIVYLQVGRSRHFIRQKCRFSPPLWEAARHSRLPFSGGLGSSAWRKSPDIQALPEGATIVADRGFNATGSQRTIRCSMVGRHHD